MDRKKFLKLKVYKNKKTGQMTVILPRKLIKKDLKKVRVKW